jgi:hypothetical protein
LYRRARTGITLDEPDDVARDLVDGQRFQRERPLVRGRCLRRGALLADVGEELAQVPRAVAGSIRSDETKAASGARSISRGGVGHSGRRGCARPQALD